MPIRHWPKSDQPREKLLVQGEKHLTDAELLAIIIASGIRNKSALDLARELLAEHGNIRAIISLPLHRYKKGIGRAKYASLKAAIELGKRCLAEPIQIGHKIDSRSRAEQFLAPRLGHLEYELFSCLFLDQHCRLLAYEELFRGTIDEATIYPREVVKRCLHHNAAKLILAHNHPSGITTPSQADQEITILIEKAVALIDVQLVDHVII